MTTTVTTALAPVTEETTVLVTNEIGQLSIFCSALIMSKVLSSFFLYSQYQGHYDEQRTPPVSQ